jgi:hypothetical protein
MSCGIAECFSQAMTGGGPLPKQGKQQARAQGTTVKDGGTMVGAMILQPEPVRP